MRSNLFSTKRHRLNRSVSSIFSFRAESPRYPPHFLPAISYARSIGLNRLHVATNGIRFAEDSALRTGSHIAAGLHGVFLQIDGMTEEKNAHRGIGNYLDIKLKAIDNISAAGMRVTLQVTVINTVNNDAVGSIVQFAAENSEKIFGVLFQPIIFAGEMKRSTTTPDIGSATRFPSSQAI